MKANCLFLFSCIFNILQSALSKKTKKIKNCCMFVCLSAACSTYVHSLCLCQTKWVHTDTLWQHCPAARSRRCKWNHKWHHSCHRHCHISCNRCLGERVGCSDALHRQREAHKMRENTTGSEVAFKGRKKRGRMQFFVHIYLQIQWNGGIVVGIISFVFSDAKTDISSSHFIW